MAGDELEIRSFSPDDEAAVVALWRETGLTRPWNDPHKDIARKASVQNDWFLVAIAEGRVVGSAMVGYDGHRGWVNYLAVSPGAQRSGVGRALLAEAERLLVSAGCPKLNVQLRATNTEALGFYEALGFVRDDVISLGRRLIPD